MRSVFFVDDNLIGNVPQAKSLLRFLADDQKPHNYEFSFGTESSLNLAQNRGWLCPPCRHCCRQLRCSAVSIRPDNVARLPYPGYP